MTDPTRAVFLSYASEDAEAAKRICEALRAAGIEVWFDQSELRGGDAWDRQIRKQIHDCALFIPIISANTQARPEGYFRLEWKLAVERTHLMSDRVAFLVPIIIDEVRDQDADVPEVFRAMQWTRLPGGETPRNFCERIVALLTGVVGPGHASVTPIPAYHVPQRVKRWRWAVVAVIGALVFLVGGWQAWRLMTPKAPARTAPTVAAFAPPPHSIAVLPFVNMSGDKEQEYFSEGLTEELLNSLSRLSELQVAARTSSFSFQGEHPDIATVARKLNVGAVLEGSVRRSAHTVRITAQLVNGVTGFHLWSQTYDRDLGDVLKLETEIANAVASALKVTLLGDLTAKIELGGTRNSAAFDAYLRGLRLMRVATSRAVALRPIEAYSEAISLDPNYGLAYAARSLAQSDYITQWAPIVVRRQYPEKARLDAERAIILAPDLGEAHAALARFLETFALDYASAWKESERAVALSPGSATVLYEYSQHAALMGKSGAAIDAARRVVTLDPLNSLSHRALGDAFWFARRYNDAIGAYQDAIAVDPVAPESYARRGLAYYAMGRYQAAKTACEAKPDYWESWLCLAMTEEKLGLHSESHRQMDRLTDFAGDALAYQYAQIEAQRGRSTQAMKWLDSALRLRDPGFRRLKTDPLMDPLRQEPRFQVIERELKFPD